MINRVRPCKATLQLHLPKPFRGLAPGRAPFSAMNSRRLNRSPREGRERVTDPPRRPRRKPLASPRTRAGIGADPAKRTLYLYQSITCDHDVAEGVRFELTVDLRPRRFSRPLP